MRPGRVSVGLIGAALLGAAGWGSLQPGGPGGEQPERRGREAAERLDDPAALRTRLERSIERTEAMAARQREALARLDAGESPAEVLRSMRWRDGQQAGEGAADRRGTAEGDGTLIRRAERGEVRPHDPRAGPGIDPAVRERLRAFLRERLPSMDAQLRQVETVDAEMAAKLFERLLPQLGEIALEMERDPAYGELRLEEMRAGLGVVDATQRLRSLGPDAGAEDRAEAEKALREAIAARFDARIRLRQHELERLARRIGSLHEEIKAEQEGREAEIERVLQAIKSMRGTGGFPAFKRGGEAPAGPRP